MIQDEMKKIPGVDKLISIPGLKETIDNYGKDIVTFIIRKQLEKIRFEIQKGKQAPPVQKIVNTVIFNTKELAECSLKKMINASGIVLHTNLARAPLGSFVTEQMMNVISGYSNLEFDLKTGKRGQRNSHISTKIKYVTGAEDAVVVNNNAAAVMLCLKTFVERKEAIISRGELVEIGGSFRIPEIMKASGAKPVEVGTTNRTRIADYENAITDKTKVLFKAHKSNYHISGFTEEASVKELAELAKKHNLIFIYDIGSGLLRKPANLPLENEPDIKSCIADGADIVTFSGDKLLGGPQAGIIAGRMDLVKKIAKAPMMRALRVGKMTLAALSSAVSSYMNDEDLMRNIPIFKFLNRTEKELKIVADQLSEKLKECGIPNEPEPTLTVVGGGTLPDLKIKSYCVKLILNKKQNAAKMHRKLLETEVPVLGILREGNLVFDIFCLEDEDIKIMTENLNVVFNTL